MGDKAIAMKSVLYIFIPLSIQSHNEQLTYQLRWSRVDVRFKNVKLLVTVVVRRRTYPMLSRMSNIYTWLSRCLIMSHYKIFFV